MSAPQTPTGATPGPWKATSSYGELTEHPYLVWSVPRDRALAQCFRISESGDDNAVEQAANAALIARAPDLLAERDALAAQVAALKAALTEIAQRGPVPGYEKSVSALMLRLAGVQSIARAALNA